MEYRRHRIVAALAVTCAGDDVNVVVGTTGEGLRMEAVQLTV
ncbi:MAG TPA: hypothetical protein VGN81_29300 [Pseudonocardiaceae bacterium]|jgi:hypothetical protein